MKKAILLSLVFVCSLLFNPGRSAAGQPFVFLDFQKTGTILQMEEVIRLLEAGFQNLYPEERFRLEVKSVQHYEKITLPAGDLSAELTLSDAARRGGNISALLSFSLEGKEVGRSRVRARVEVYTEVLVAAGHLGRHLELQAKDLQPASRSLSSLPADFLFEPGQIRGKRTTAAINRGEVLRAGMVEEPPLLKKGDRVLLLIENHKLRIVTLGEAKEEGRRGEQIKLINLASRREVSGRVLDSHTVRIDF